MKKTLKQIFDQADAVELESLIEQNDAPELSKDTLDSIKNKVYAKTGLSQAPAKKKKPLLLRWKSYVAVAACFCLVFGLMFGVGGGLFQIAQAAEIDEKSSTEPNVQEFPEGFEYVVFLNENNHLIFKTKDEVIMDVDFEYVWSEGQANKFGTEFSYLAVYHGHLGSNYLFANKKEGQILLNKYFSFPIPLKKVISGEEREHMIDFDDLPNHSKSIWYQDQKDEDGVDNFVATILEDGSLKFIDSEFNVYVSEPGVFKNLWY